MPPEWVGRRFNEHDEQFEKYKGLRVALAEHGLDFSSRRVVYSDFTMESGHQQTLTLLAQAPDLDAIVFDDDNIAAL